MESKTRKRVRIETAGGQAFNVPNDEEGRTFLRSMRKFINRPTWRFSARGRGPRLRPGDTHVSFSRSLSLPQGESEWLAVYLGGTSYPWGGFRSLLTPATRPTYYGVKLPTAGPKLTPDEQKMLQKILEDAEIDHTHDSEKGEIFYSVFQKLVDI